MKHLQLLLFGASTLLAAICFGQTNPTSFDLASGNFSFDGFTDVESTTYPDHTQGWRFASEPDAAFTGEASADRDLVPSSANPTSGSIKNEAADGISFLNSGSNGIGALVVALNTTGRENITLGWLAEDIRDGSTRENGIKLQYRIGETGDFTDVENTTYISDPSDFNEAVTFSGIALPADANDEAVVQVRWLYFFSSGSGARDRIRLDEVLISSEAMPLPTVSVTFLVDMSNEDVDPLGVGISGSFNGFAFEPMTDQGNGLYAIALALEVGAEVEYKFRNGDAFEDVPGECGTGPFNNRTLTVPDNDISLDVVCYSLCGSCPIPGASYELTIRVNASQVFNVSPNGIHIAGTFNNFQPEPMTNLGILNYTITVLVEEGTTVEWKFLNGNSFDGQEIVPEACGTDDGFGGFNRVFVMPEEDTTLENVCFSSCAPCGILDEHEVVIQVDVSQLATLDPAGIYIGGSFTEFIPEPMEDLGNGIWSYTLIAAEGQPLTWRFINGTSYDNAETVPEACGVNDGLGEFNRFFTVGEQDVVLELVCFSSCALCADPPAFFDITFQVDASQIEIDPAGIYIAGTFNGFSPAPMVDAGNGIYTFTASVEEASTVLWKYLNGDSFDGVESVPSACGLDDGFGGFNRDFEMPSENTVLEPVCFSSCEACQDPGEFFDLVFQVDASQIDIDPAGIHIAGTFNGFNPEPMQDGGNGIYTFSAIVLAGSEVLWKYTNGPGFDGVESVPSECGADDGFGGFNRDLTMPAQATVLDLVCFSSCEICQDPGETFTLTFQVDASQILVLDPAGIHIAGTFNDFNPAPMTDAGGGIYTFTAEIESGSEVLWKYLNGPSFDGAESVPGECGQDDGFGGFNRNAVMPGQNAVLSVVCFGSCVECVVGVNDATALNALSVYPNPNEGIFSILAPVSGEAQISVYDLSGRLVYREQSRLSSGQALEINTSIAAKGFYLVDLQIGTQRFATRIAVL